MTALRPGIIDVISPRVCRERSDRAVRGYWLEWPRCGPLRSRGPKGAVMILICDYSGITRDITNVNCHDFLYYIIIESS